MALPLDNPSYFSIANEPSTSTGRGAIPKFHLFKKRSNSHETIVQPPTPPAVTPTGNSARIPLRTLLRSVSSNSADSNQELLVLGEPRPSDIAPPSPNLSRHDNPRRLKKRSANELMAHDLVYCPLATSEKEVVEKTDFSDEDEEEVFLMEDSARYYNLAASSDNRRYSTSGGFDREARERNISASNTFFSEEPAVVVVHATDPERQAEIGKVKTLQYTSSVKRRCEKCIVKGADICRCTNMDDILIVSSGCSGTATLWVNYLGTCFEQLGKQRERQPLKVFHVTVEDVHSVDADFEQRIQNVRLNVVILCPQLLNQLVTNPTQCNTFFKLLRSDRTLAMLLGVSDGDITDTQHAPALGGGYRRWRRHTVGQDQDQEFAREFLGTAVSMLARAKRQQTQTTTEPNEPPCGFSVVPKKVRHGQNRLVILLTEPLAASDLVTVSVERDGDLYEVKSVKRRNPYTLKFAMPERCLDVSCLARVLVTCNGKSLGSRPVKCESRLRELDQILRAVDSPLDFMCQTLGFSPSGRDQLDGWLLHAFQKNVPPDFRLLSGSANASNKHPHAHEEYPTLLHFAARHGLERLAWQLLECPGGEIACELRNSADLTPAEMAESAGHTKLASALRGYMQMNEFTNAYSQLKEMTEAKSERAEAAAHVPVDDEEYLLPLPANPTNQANQTYSIPPPARPYSPARPVTGYLHMQPGTSLPNRPTKPTPNSNTTANATTHLNQCEDKVQGELLEIINDFKNNVFSLTEVEKLVDDWRNRNDVQKSFREKEEQLNVMRKEYERIQQRMKEEMRRPTPFERLKKLFSRGKSNSSATEDVLERSGLRPISSLSLQSTASSSSSSGRMSTISGCSLGDSGTHSDHEMKQTLGAITSDHEYFEINEPKSSGTSLQTPGSFSYLVPPAPKPVQPVIKIQQSTFNPINERPPHPVPRSDEGDQYYIQFPPSGLPVAGALRSRSPSPNKAQYLSTIADKQTSQPLINYVNMPAEEEHLPEYINVHTTNGK